MVFDPNYQSSFETAPDVSAADVAAYFNTELAREPGSSAWIEAEDVEYLGVYEFCGMQALYWRVSSAPAFAVAVPYAGAAMLMMTDEPPLQSAQRAGEI